MNESEIIGDLDKYLMETLEKVEEGIKKDKKEKVIELLNKRIEKLENWWYALPMPMKDYFEKKYKEGLDILYSLLEEFILQEKR